MFKFVRQNNFFSKYFFILLLPCLLSGFKDVKEIDAPAVLISTHAGYTWNPHGVTKFATNLILKSLEPTTARIFLQKTNQRNDYYTELSPRDQVVYSVGGEFDFEIYSNHILSMGGWFSYCQQTTICGILKNLRSNPDEPVKIDIFIDATYEHLDTDFVKNNLTQAQRAQLKEDYTTGTSPLRSIVQMFGQDRVILDRLTGFAVAEYGLSWRCSRYDISVGYKERFKDICADGTKQKLLIRFK